MCEFQTASEVLSAFRRNKNNGEIDQEETIFYSEILYAFVVFFFLLFRSIFMQFLQFSLDHSG